MMITSTISDILFNNDYKESFLLRNNYLIWIILLSYVFFVKRLGPEIMKTRKPFDLRSVIIPFNVILLLWNLYLCLNAGYFSSKYWSSRCSSVFRPKIEEDLKNYGYLQWQGLLVKIVELLDTVFFILRKKNNQASFFHVFHHAIVVLIFWVGSKEDGLRYYLLLLSSVNFGIHVITYVYYALSAVGPSVRKYLWWKKYLTMIQLSQFLVMISYMLNSFGTNCEEFTKAEKSFFCIYVFICGLLLNFYFKSYKKEATTHEKQSMDKKISQSSD